ncbi:MaoC/PaaZ C-terminal domain-containing protein [Actinomycetes bacterium KLBMP 9759]
MSLASLYVKAALGAVGPRSRELPAAELTRAIAVDRAHLAAYARVCGFAVGDTLPLTYPHVLAFPLQVELMASRAFPLSLPGLVHVRNTITVRRRIDAAERLDVRVHAERLRAHPKGAQVDLVAEIGAAGEPVWHGRSTYLARGAGAPPGDVPEPSPQPGIDDGPAVATWRVDAGTGRRYAAVSGDVNPIHLHPLTAKAFGFPRAIAHGMWTAAHALAALQGRAADATTYDVGFAKPLLLPSTVELRTRRAGDGWDLDVRSRRAEHVRATLRALT